MSESTDGLAASWSSAWNRNPEASESVLAETAGLGWIYVSRLSFGRAPVEILDRLASLGRQDARFLRMLRFAASSEVRDFVSDVVPRLVSRLPRSVRLDRSTAREVRGRVDWSATMRERQARGLDPTVFVVSQPQRSFDTPANRVLVFLLEKVADVAAEVAVRSNGEVIQGRLDVATIGRDAARWRRASVLAGVPTPLIVNGQMRQELRTARLTEFRDQVVALLDLYDGVVLGEDMQALRSLVGERIWLPKEPERVFELWSLFTIATSLEKAGWTIIKLRLLGTGRGDGATFVMHRSGARISLHYQATPREMLRDARYTRLLKAYGVTGSSRRPDIVVCLDDGRRSSVMIVEVKLTDDRDYLVDAVYKVFGYLADFHSTLGKAPPTRAALIVWGGLSSTPTRRPDDDVAIFDVAGMRDGSVVALIEALLDRGDDKQA